MQQLLVFLDSHPDASLSEMAEAIGRSKSTAVAYVVELETNNLLKKENEGWKVLEK